METFSTSIPRASASEHTSTRVSPERSCSSARRRCLAGDALEYSSASTPRSCFVKKMKNPVIHGRKWECDM